MHTRGNTTAPDRQTHIKETPGTHPQRGQRADRAWPRRVHSQGQWSCAAQRSKTAHPSIVYGIWIIEDV